MTDANLVQQVYTSIQQHFIETGRAPHYTELAGMLGITPEEARVVQREAAAAGVGCWMSADTDYIGSWAPFSNLPTQYLVTIEGQQRWYAQCGLEALAVCWLFGGREVSVEARCLDCGESLNVRMKDGMLLEANPETIVGHITLPIRQWGAVANAFL
jgi:hypothetical protein